MSWFRPGQSAEASGHEINAVIDQWTQDSSAAKDRTLELIRTGHMIMGPAVVLGLLLVVSGSNLTVAALIYLSGLIAVLGLVPRRIQAVALSAFDLLLIAFVSTSDPRIWLALIVPAAAAMTIGWLVSPRATWALYVVGVASMAAAAYESQPDGWEIAIAVFAGTTAALNVNNLVIVGPGRDGVLRVADLVESLPVIVWESDPRSGALTRAVGWIDELLGYTATEWRMLPVARRVHRDDLHEYLESSARAVELDEPITHEFRLRCSDGSAIGVREVVRRVAVGDRFVLRGVILDITEEAVAREAVERLAAVVAHQMEPLLVIAPRRSADEELMILQVNRAFAAMAAIDPAVASGRGLTAVAPWLPKSIVADLDDFVTTGRAGGRDEIEIRTPRGGRVFDYSLVGLPDDSVAVQFVDVTDRRHATDLIRHQAFHDPLTGLPNRTLLFDRLAHALSAMQRDGADVGLLWMDLNQFKEINDTLGHMYGDELLTTIGDRLRLLSRESDTVARLGGDEFAMVVAGATHHQLGEIADRVFDEVKLPVMLGGIEVEVSASIGGAVAPLHGDDAHTLLQRADIAMYDAKRSGVPYRLYARDDDRHSLDRLTLMGELKNLLGDQLRVWFQPKVDLRSGHVVELEALARWEHPRLGLLGPAKFIELCEVSGIISELTFRVLDLALAAASDWPEIRVAVNVPVRNLYDRTLPTQVGDKLDLYGVAADRLILEITEREIMEDHRAIFDVLEDLHGRGVKISIDDFGTGFSSLTHLRRLPISEIKIDQSFVSGMLDRENDYIIARSIIDLAHNLGHRVVAEGIEDTATLDLLRGLGCDAAQGFLFSRPGPVERIRQRMAAGPAIDEHGRLAWSTASS